MRERWIALGTEIARPMQRSGSRTSSLICIRDVIAVRSLPGAVTGRDEMIAANRERDQSAHVSLRALVAKRAAHELLDEVTRVRRSTGG